MRESETSAVCYIANLIKIIANREQSNASFAREKIISKKNNFDNNLPNLSSSKNEQ